MKKCIILTLAIAGLALVSCQKEKFIENSEAPANEIALKSATISTKSAIDGTAFPAGYGMLVSAYRNVETGTSVGTGDASGNYFTGITFNKGTGTTWVAGSPKYWPLNGKLDFLCIASAGLNTAVNGVEPTCVWGDGGNVAKKVVATVPDNSAKFDDILYGSANGQSYVANGTPITFNHAECAVVFFAKSNVPYDSATNTGITITGITLNQPKTGGVLTVNNPAAGASTGSLSASWDLSSGTTTDLNARMWDSGNTGVKYNESELTSLNLNDSYGQTELDNGTYTASTTLTKKFGDAYVILPPQNAVSFDIKYTIHNGKDDSGTAVNNTLVYRYIPTADDPSTTTVDETEKWEMGKKVVYLINITLHQIEIKPTVIDWVNDFRNINIGN